jgi:predicted ATPase
MLLIIDNCEHVIETVAALTERIFQAAPEIHILATAGSLRAEGEQVYCLNRCAAARKFAPYCGAGADLPCCAAFR